MKNAVMQYFLINPALYSKKKLKYFSTLGSTHTESEFPGFALKTPLQQCRSLIRNGTDWILRSSISFGGHQINFTALLRGKTKNETNKTGSWYGTVEGWAEMKALLCVSKLSETEPGSAQT